MHRFASLTALMIAATTLHGTPTASAADLGTPLVKAPVSPPLYDWSGFYAGVNIGGGWGESSASLVSATPGFGTAIAVGRVPASVGVRRNGVIGGGQAGYNWQAGTFVFGLETDLQASDVHGSGSFFYPGPHIAVLTTLSTRLDWFGTARGRLGFVPVPQALLYVTGGVAYGRINRTGSLVANPLETGDFHGSASKTKTGWAIGAGAEWAFAPRWSVRAEYLRMDLGRTTVRVTDPQFPVDSLSYRLDHREHILRIGVNYKFGS